MDYEGASLFGYYIACRNRKCELSKMPDAQNLFRTEAEAIAAWNQRADDAQVIKNTENYNLRPGIVCQFIPDGEKHELTANDNLLTETVVSENDYVCNDTKMVDSREQLEEDAFELASTIWNKGCAWESGVEDFDLVGWKEEDIIALLDRQAVITERELCEYFHMLDRTDELEEQVISLTAKLCRERKSREYAYNELNKMLALDGKRVKQINELTAERDQLDRDLTAEHALVIQFEHDNEMLRDTAKDLTAERDELRERIRKLTMKIMAMEDKHKIDSERWTKIAHQHQEDLRNIMNLCDKLREKQHVCDVQRDSFLKLETENAKLRRKLDAMQ